MVLWVPLRFYCYIYIFYLLVMWFGGMELGWGGFDRPKLEMLIPIRIPFSFRVS